MQSALKALHALQDSENLRLRHIVAGKTQDLMLSLRLRFPSVFKNPKVRICPVCGLFQRIKTPASPVAADACVLFPTGERFMYILYDFFKRQRLQRV